MLGIDGPTVKGLGIRSSAGHMETSDELSRPVDFGPSGLSGINRGGFHARSL